jgi:hypothetical protein
MVGLGSLYTAQKVHRPPATALDVACDAEEAQWDIRRGAPVAA